MSLLNVAFCAEAGPAYSLAPGGRMRQEIHADPYTSDDWDLEHTSRCFVHNQKIDHADQLMSL
jgi:hypothetical protein